jgi:uridylate kinase
MAEDGKRTLLKLSGEALAGEERFGIDASILEFVATQIKAAHDLGHQIAIVIGAGNILRGSAVSGNGSMDRVTGDYAGMLATIINSLALQDAIEKTGVGVCLQSALKVEGIAGPFVCRQAVEEMERGHVVIFAGGTGNPYFTTDTAAALRAVQIGADVLLMAKNKVDGVYEANPREEPSARRFVTLSYMEALTRRLAVMDGAALALCMANSLPIMVFDLMAPNGITRVLQGEKLGTYVGDVDTVMASAQPAASSS